MRPTAGEPAFSSGGWGTIFTSKGPVAWRGMTACFPMGAGEVGLVWACVGMADATSIRQATAMQARIGGESPVEEDTISLSFGTGGGEIFLLGVDGDNAVTAHDGA